MADIVYCESQRFYKLHYLLAQLLVTPWVWMGIGTINYQYLYIDNN
jgi:hypothetical protein